MRELYIYSSGSCYTCVTAYSSVSQCYLTTTGILDLSSRHCCSKKCRATEKNYIEKRYWNSDEATWCNGPMREADLVWSQGKMGGAKWVMGGPWNVWTRGGALHAVRTNGFELFAFPAQLKRWRHAVSDSKREHLSSQEACYKYPSRQALS